MTYQRLESKYCPACGSELDHAIAVGVPDDELPEDIQGEFERAGAHAVVEAGEIRVYQHGGG